MSIIIIATVIVTILGLTNLALDIFFIYFFITKYIEKREDTKAYYELGLGIFFILNLIGMVISIVSRLVVRTLSLEFIASSFSIVSLIIIMYVLENQLWKNRTRYVLSIVFMSYFSIMIIIGILSNFTITFISFPMSYVNLGLVLVIPISYFYLSYKGQGYIRTISLAFGIGFSFIMFGGSTTTQNMLALDPITFANPTIAVMNDALSMLYITIGFVIILIGIIKSKEK